MISSGRQIAVYAFGEPVDMRKGFEGLFGLVRDHLGQKSDQVFPDYSLGERLGLVRSGS